MLQFMRGLINALNHKINFVLFALFAVFAVIALTAPMKALGYFSTIDTGELVSPTQYQMILEPQLILNKYDGINMIGRLDTGLNESSSIRGILGFGKVDFQIGGMYKYVPFPDTDKQPAIGGEVGAILARVNGQTEFSVRIHPLISKRLETEVGDVIPYASLPLGVTTKPDKTFVPVQIVGGAEFRPLNIANLSLFTELGINITEAFSYISLAAAWRFDDAALKSGSTKKK